MKRNTFDFPQSNHIYYCPVSGERLEKPNKQTITFDSSFEFSVYLKLVKLVGEHSGVIAHHSVLLIPQSGFFPQANWEVDFYIPRANTYIEAKGNYLKTNSFAKSEFVTRMKALASNNPSVYERLLIVSDPAMKIATDLGSISVVEMLSRVKLLGRI